MELYTRLRYPQIKEMYFGGELDYCSAIEELVEAGFDEIDAEKAVDDWFDELNLED